MDLEIRVLFGSIMFQLAMTNVKDTASSPFNMADNVFAETITLLIHSIKRDTIVNVVEPMV